MWIRTSSLEDNSWDPSFSHAAWSEGKHLYLPALKNIVVIALGWSIQPCLAVAVMWIGNVFGAVLSVSSEQTPEEGCTLSTQGVPSLDFCNQEGENDLAQECNSVAKSGAVTITNSYFSDYSGTKWTISKYMSSLPCTTPWGRNVHALPASLMLFASGTLTWAAALQLNTQAPAFGIRSKYYST